jgi:hypothetical protein
MTSLMTIRTYKWSVNCLSQKGVYTYKRGLSIIDFSKFLTLPHLNPLPGGEGDERETCK